MNRTFSDSSNRQACDGKDPAPRPRLEAVNEVSPYENAMDRLRMAQAGTDNVIGVLEARLEQALRPQPSAMAEEALENARVEVYLGCAIVDQTLDAVHREERMAERLTSLVKRIGI